MVFLKILFIYFAVLGFELRAYTLSYLPALVCDGFFELGSQELFAWAGFEL
jgi:hypothetical protein